jgi:pilus assembly protein CpaB
MIEYQLDLVLPNMFTNITDAVGKVARWDIPSYTVLTTALVSDQLALDEGSDAALLIPKGSVAISIPINRLTSVSYAPQRGDHVNVLVTMMFVDVDAEWQSILPNLTGNVIPPDGGAVLTGTSSTPGDTLSTLLLQPFSGPSLLGRLSEEALLEDYFYLVPSESQRPRLVSQTLIQNVIVLQMGEFETDEEIGEPTPTPSGSETPAPTPTPAQATPEVPPEPPDVITLIVRPQDAVTLNYLIYSGAELTLVLRNPTDDSVLAYGSGDNELSAVTLSFLLDRYSIPIPVKLPYGLEPRVHDLVSPLAEPVATPVP